MIMITILSVQEIEDNGPLDSLTAHVEITDGVDTYFLPVGGIPPETSDVQAYLDARTDSLWAAAEAKAITLDVFEVIVERALLKGLFRVVVALFIMTFDEINTLRAHVGLTVRTNQQALNKLDSILDQGVVGTVLQSLKRRLGE